MVARRALLAAAVALLAVAAPSAAQTAPTADAASGTSGARSLDLTTLILTVTGWTGYDHTGEASSSLNCAATDERDVLPIRNAAADVPHPHGHASGCC